MHTVEIGGKVYRLCPFTAGQMRRRVDPSFEQTAALIGKMSRLEKGEDVSMLEISMETRAIQREQAELIVLAMQNQYQNFTVETMDDLTPGEISEIFNKIMVLTQSGGKRGEAPAPAEASR